MIPRYSLPKMAAIWSEKSRFQKMLDVEICAAEALSKLGKVPKQAIPVIKRKARFNVGRIKQIEKRTRHDVVAFVENVTENIGKEGKYIHLGLTSYDVVDTALACQLKEASEILINDLERLRSALIKKAKKYKYTLCVGRTHGVHAEPTTFGLKLALFYDETRRNHYRMTEAKDVISVGKISGAVGTYSNIDPYVEEYVCKKLKIYPAPISTQVVQRDRHAHFLSTLAVIGSSIEMFATEIRHLQRTEVLEAEEPFEKGQKGSSAMPHKRNPVVCERLCGLARILRANALAAMENVALWHERDISHSSVERIILPDSTILLDFMINDLINVIDGLIVYPERMKENLDRTHGLIFSSRVLVLLVGKGLSRNRAYELVQRNAMKSWGTGEDFKSLLLKDKDVKKLVSEKELTVAFNAKHYLRNIDRIFRRLGL
ncbi:MAG: adenylosuccinate lyase [Candidatus Omnitrophota bacterium]